MPEKSWKADDDNPDRFGEELGDDANIWRIYKEVADKDDEYRINNWNRGLDNLALFAGLLSAVTSAFLLELRNDTQLDYSKKTFQAVNAYVAKKPYTFYDEDTFTVPPDARAANALWVLSLILSLTAALVALMGKDWIGMYARVPSCNLRERADIRTFRLHCVEQWHMSAVISAAPVLLHISLLLFGAGLVVFMAPDQPTQIFGGVISGMILLLYLSTVISAVLSPWSPFQSPATQAIRRRFFSDNPAPPTDRANAAAGPVRNAHVGSPPGPPPNNAVAQQTLPVPVAQSPTPTSFWTRAISRFRGMAIARDEELGQPSPIVVHPAPAPERSVAPPPAPPLRHWDTIPAVDPDRIIQSLVWLGTASPHPRVERAIITALGDRTVFGDQAVADRLGSEPGLTAQVLGRKVAQCLSTEHLRAPGVSDKDARRRFRDRLPKKVEWTKADLPALLRYVRLRNNWPDSDMGEPESTQLDALFKDALLDKQLSPELYIYAVCLASTRGLAIDLKQVKERSQHIDLALTTASFLMALLQPPEARANPPYNELVVMAKCFGWHRRPADAPMFPTVLRKHLPSPARDSPDEPPAGDIELLAYIIRHYVGAACSEGLYILLDLLELQPSQKYHCIFDLFDREKSPVASPAIWTICRESPAHALRLMHALPLDEPAVPGRVTRTAVVLALSWLVRPDQQLPTLQSHRTGIISEIERGTRALEASVTSISGSFALDNGADTVISIILGYSTLTHPVRPVDCDWELLAAIASYLVRRLGQLLPDAKDENRPSRAESELREVGNLVNLFNAVGPSVGGIGDRSEICNLGRMLVQLAKRVAFSTEIARFLRALDGLQQVCTKLDLEAAYPPNKELIDQWTTISFSELSLEKRKPMKGLFGHLFKGTLRGAVVAVKRWPYALEDPEGGSNLIRSAISAECSHLKSLHHENIILLMGVIIDSFGDTWTVFPWAENGTVMRYTAKFSPADRLQLILDVARGLEYMHSGIPQILHMNLNSSNILVNSMGRALIGGFGLSITLPDSGCAARDCRHDSYSDFGWSPGIRPYRAPEMLEDAVDKFCGPAVDVFAWAMTAVEILSDVRPLRGQSRHPNGLERLVLGGTRPLQNDHSRSLTGEAAELLGRCWPLLERGWAHDPNERPSMEQVVDELTAIKAARAQAAAIQGSAPAVSTSGTQ